MDPAGVESDRQDLNRRASRPVLSHASGRVRRCVESTNVRRRLSVSSPTTAPKQMAEVLLESRSNLERRSVEITSRVDSTRTRVCSCIAVRKMITTAKEPTTLTTPVDGRLYGAARICSQPYSIATRTAVSSCSCEPGRMRLAKPTR
eukprot:6551244-Prymnesium_polylepis.3